MASVPMTFMGELTHPDGSTEVVSFEGYASLTGLGVGGGPIYPPDKPPVDPGLHPEHPIVLPPTRPPVDPDLHPEHPIVLPPIPPIDPPTEPPTTPPDPQWVWGYSPSLKRWIRVYVPGEEQPGPK